jgi:hypothetical protein
MLGLKHSIVFTPEADAKGGQVKVDEERFLSLVGHQLQFDWEGGAPGVATPAVAVARRRVQKKSAAEAKLARSASTSTSGDQSQGCLDTGDPELCRKHAAAPQSASKRARVSKGLKRFVKRTRVSKRSKRVVKKLKGGA